MQLGKYLLYREQGLEKYWLSSVISRICTQGNISVSSPILSVHTAFLGLDWKWRRGGTTTWERPDKYPSFCESLSDL